MKKLILKLFAFSGFELRRFNLLNNRGLVLQMVLKTYGINTVIDIGANIGQFSKSLRMNGYKKKIVSFEPLSSAHNKLLKNSKNDHNWKVAPRMAIGSEDSQIKMYIAGNSQSSSALEMLNSHIDAATNSKYIGSEMADIKMLDSVCHEFINQEDRIFLKIDTQGFEDRVLAGGQKLMKQVFGIQIEMSLVLLYKDQILYEEMTSKMKDLGFELWFITPEFSDPVSGRLLQVDATFVRTL
jgi:FkbM family methyltransferase